ncbi:MAG: DMT family transporter [Trueperaceae bacterium]
MTGLALALVFGSAFVHAAWNLLAKRAAGGVEFVWLVALLVSLCYAPVLGVYLWFERPEFTLQHALLAVGSAVIHVFYFVSLQRGYRAGDLSLVYPLARGSGPALATLLAVLFLGERPGLQALLGTLLVVLSVFVLAGSGGKRQGGAASRRAVLYGLATGVFISLYTTWDGYAVAHAGASPLVFMLAGEAVRAAVLAPIALRNRPEVARIWREARGATFGVALLSPLAYLLVLTAMQFTPVSLVAPTREISILIGTILGARLLSEGHWRRRLLGAAGMVAGVTLLALA